MQSNRALTLRSNRFLGSSLLDKGLITNANLEAANERFMEVIQSNESFKNASVLKIMLHDLKVIDETLLLKHTREEYGIGLIDLNFIEFRQLPTIDIDLDLCWSTLTVPFDKAEQTYMLATCYYMSSPVVKYWEDLLDGKVIWYATSMVSINHGLERTENFLDTKKTPSD